MRRSASVLLVLVALQAGVGCTTIASTLGFSPPVHKLTPAAETFRMAAVNPAPLPRELNKSVLPAYVLEPGDTLAVEPTELDSPVRLPGSQPILPDGTIDLGQYGRPVVAGKTVQQAEAEVRRSVAARVAARPKDKADKADYGVNVRLIGRESKVYYVLGEANSPRAYPLAGRETVLDGLLTAGGITRQADTAKIVLSRPSQPDGCRVVLPVCYLDIVQLGDTSTNYQLQPGDRIYIPSRPSFEGFGFGKRNKDQCGPCLAAQVGCVTGGTCSPGAAGPAGDVLIPVAPAQTPDPRATPMVPAPPAPQSPPAGSPTPG